MSSLYVHFPLLVDGRARKTVIFGGLISNVREYQKPRINDVVYVLSAVNRDGNKHMGATCSMMK